MTSKSVRASQALIRPALTTKFRIDYSLWDRADRDLEVYLRSHLCPTHQESYAKIDADATIDHVDPKTAEVIQVTGIQHVLISHCATEPDYITPQTSLVDAVFRVFLANGNNPLSPVELSEIVGRPARMILRTFSGQRVYKGIRPYIEE
jgi:hypothetical protein